MSEINKENLQLFGVMSVADADRLQGQLRKFGARMEKLFNQATCSSGGCGSSVEVWIYKEDVEQVKQAIVAQQQKNLSGLNFNPDLLTEVYDSSKETATCPACGTNFSTKLSECPECGLCF